MRKVIILLLAIMCMLSIPLYSQVNLLLNPSFELYDTCPYAFDQIQLAMYWSPIDTSGVPNGITPLGSSEYINICSHDSLSHEASVPRNDYFYHYPHTGSGMAQNMMYFDESFEHPYRRDYTQGRLNESLQAGVSYCVTFYVALEPSSGYAINHIGAYFDDGSIDRGLDTSCCPSIGWYAGYMITIAHSPAAGHNSSDIGYCHTHRYSGLGRGGYRSV